MEKRSNLETLVSQDTIINLSLPLSLSPSRECFPVALIQNTEPFSSRSSISIAHEEWRSARDKKRERERVCVWKDLVAFAPTLEFVERNNGRWFFMSPKQRIKIDILAKIKKWWSEIKVYSNLIEISIGMNNFWSKNKMTNKSGKTMKQNQEFRCIYRFGK